MYTRCFHRSLLTLIKRKRPFVSYVLNCFRTARTRAACVSLSLFNDFNQREGFVNPSVDITDANLYRLPFGRYRQFVASFVSYSHEVGGAGRRRVPQ
jgi:hypothetical protein